MRDERRNYVIVGGFVLAMGAALILWIALLSGRTGATDTYYIRYANVTGLDEGTQILFEGYPVGRIDEIGRVSDSETAHFRVGVSVSRGWPIPDDSVAEIRASGLLGGYVIHVNQGGSAAMLEPGDEIASAEAADVFGAVSDVAGEVQGLIRDEIQPLFDEIGEKTPEILDNLESFSARLDETVRQIQTLVSRENTQRVGSILHNLERTSGNVAQLSEDLDQTRTQLDDVLAALQGMVAEHGSELGESLADLHHVLEAVARHIDSVAHNMEVTSRNMNEFSRQVRDNPGVLLRGRSTNGDSAGSP